MNLNKLQSLASEAYIRKRFFFCAHFVITLFLYWDHLEPVISQNDSKQIIELKKSFTHLFYLCYLFMVSILILSKKGTLQLRLMLIPFTAILSTFISLFLSQQLGFYTDLELNQGFYNTYLKLGMVYGHIFIPVLAMAPLWICLELMFVGPSIKLSYVQQSYSKLNKYAIHSRSISEEEKLDVLLLEDDITSADPLLKLYRKINLSCKHVSTIEEGEVLFEKHKDDVQIIMLDIFIRVVDPNFPRTGLDWLRDLNKDYPKGKRNFIVIVYTGHQDILDDETRPMVDYVLTKPWNPREYLNYLADRGIFEVKPDA